MSDNGSGGLRRRDFLRMGAAAGAGFALGPWAARGAEADAERPNILLFVSDDLGWRDVGCFGSPNARTPNLDRLAFQGMRFTNAYTASPVCGPTRAQLYTGIYPVNSHAYFNHPHHYVKESARTLPACLGDLGYRVGIVGKIDAGPAEAYPFERLPYEFGNMIGDSLPQFITRDADQPFCLVVGSGKPHTPWVTRLEGLDPADVVVSEHLVDTLETREALTLYYGEVAKLDDQVGECLKILEETGRAEDTLVLWTSEQGAETPFGKGTLYDHGMKLAVIARWPGRVEPGTVCDEIIQHIDFLPTIVDAAGGPERPNWDGKSFLPMLEGETLQNHEFGYGCYGDKRAIRTKQFKYIRNLSPEQTIKHGPSPFNTGAMASDPDNKFYPAWSHPKSWLPLAEENPDVARKIEWFKQRPPEELYDIEKDPFEQENLVGNSEYAEALADLRARCDAIMAAQGDEGMQTVGELKRWQRQQHKAGKGRYGRSTSPIMYPGKKR